MLEAVAQRELHPAPLGEDSTIVAKGTGAAEGIVGDAVRVEANGVGDIESLSSELKLLFFNDVKDFGKSCINAEVTISNEEVAFS